MISKVACIIKTDRTSHKSSWTVYSGQKKRFNGRRKPSVFDEWRNRPEKFGENRRKYLVVIEKFFILKRM
jgi:hypothetical protein